MGILRKGGDKEEGYGGMSPTETEGEPFESGVT